MLPEPAAPGVPAPTAVSVRWQLTRRRHRPAHEPRGFHFEGFDGLRAIAAIAVALTHSAFISGFNVHSDTSGPFSARLDIGVAVFFVISGFLLYRPFVLARFRATSGPRARFVFLAPLPAHLPGVLARVHRRAARPGVPRHDWRTPSFGGLVTHYTLTHIYFHNHVLGPVQQSWTLATELSFYLMLPIYGPSCAGCGRSTVAHCSAPSSPGSRSLLLLGRVPHLGVLRATGELQRPVQHLVAGARRPVRVGMFLAVGSAWLQAHDREEPRFVRGRGGSPVASGSSRIASFWS